LTTAAAIHRPAITPLRVSGALAAVLVAAIVIFVLLFQWNWLRGPLARYASAQLNRPVTIAGNLEVHPWSLTPWARVSGVTIGNPTWAGPAPMAKLPRFTAQIELKPLIFSGKVVLPLVEADQPDIDLLRDTQGRESWRLHPSVTPEPPLRLPPIRHLIIADGRVRYVDERRRIHFAGTVSSSEEVVGAGQGQFRLTGDGTMNSARFTLAARGGPLVNVDAARPYAFDLHIETGSTRIAADGRITHPFDFGEVSGQVHAQGPDFGQLYALTGLSLPNTPPYNLAAAFSREGQRTDFRHLHGRVGDSDLAGELSVSRQSARPMIVADLSSQRLRLADLEAVIGGAPRHTAGHTLSPAEKAEAQRLVAEHRLLPDATLDFPRIRATDARLTYRARSVEAGKLPIRALSLKLALNRGLLTIDPLAVSLPQGDLTGNIRLDARGATPVTGIDLRLANARLENLIERGAAQPPIVGGLFARAKLTGAGASVRAAAGHANGQFTVVIPGGQMRQAFAELMGIDVARGLFLLLAKNHGSTPIRCAVADFRATDGVLHAQSIVLDTGVVIATGSGEVNLRDETLNLTLSGKPKKFRLIHIGAPITLKGSLSAPKAGVDIVKAAPQLAAATALGALVAPLAVILPFVGPGLAKDADCAALVGQAEARGAPVGRRR
jgi:uncharacterized protein involved in outer membrane biogenesis